MGGSLQHLYLLLAGLVQFQVCHAFAPLHNSFHGKKRDCLELSTLAEPNQDTSSIVNKSISNDWNASGSFGSLLMQMKNDQIDALDLDAKVNKTFSPPPYVEPIDIVMDLETARELDASVVPLSTRMVPEVILPTPSLYLDHDATAFQELPFSQPEHYRDRIDRDRRHLAVSIASACDTVNDWRDAVLERAGLKPLLLCVTQGARQYKMEYEWLLEPNEEETFQMAGNACRALRDVCAIDPELAAVVTDGILRANTHWNNALMQDFCTLLQDKELGRYQRSRQDRLRCQLYVTQLLLAICVASDEAVEAIRATPGLKDAILACSSFARKEQRRRWLRYPGEIVKWVWKSRKKRPRNLRRPFLEAATISNDLNGQVQKTANQILAAIGYNQWIPKIPGQRGLRILSLDGGGSRGMAAVQAVRCLVEAAGNGAEVADSFDIIAGTSTGGIIGFLVGLRRESSAEALERYNILIKEIFVKSALSTPFMVFTTATYDESPFMEILSTILKDSNMLDSRADPAVPLVFCVTSKMSSTPTHVALFRNYNYATGELPDPFTVDPDKARKDLGLPLDIEDDIVRRGYYVRKEATKKSPGVKVTGGSRYPGSFRVLQRYALRASTAAPTVFKPVMMGGEIYSDGGIVASNPTAIAIHEARALFPSVPIELIVSIGTGGFLEQKR